MTHEHLNDEQLSAYLDEEPVTVPSVTSTGDAGAAAQAVGLQVEGCARCRQRLAALAAARALVRRPVSPVPPSVRATAVAAALHEALGPESGPDSSSVSASPVPITTNRLTTNRRRPHRSPRVLVGAAAAAVVVAVGVGVSVEQSRGPSTTAKSAAAPAAKHSVPAVPGASRSSALGPTEIPDLGSVTNVQGLRAQLAPVLTPAASASTAAGPQAASGVPNDANAPAATGTFGSGSSAVAVGATPCVAAVERASGTSATLTLVATATYAGTPAVVVVLQPPATSSTAPSPVAVVVARSGCRVLVRTTL